MQSDVSELQELEEVNTPVGEVPTGVTLELSDHNISSPSAPSNAQQLLLGGDDQTQVQRSGSPRFEDYYQQLALQAQHLPVAGILAAPRVPIAFNSASSNSSNASNSSSSLNPLANLEGGNSSGEEPLYVNALQYHRILKRRQQRARMEAENRLVRRRRPYLHESRHHHAKTRQRGNDGRFLTAEQLRQAEIEEQQAAQDQSNAAGWQEHGRRDDSDNDDCDVDEAERRRRLSMRPPQQHLLPRQPQQQRSLDAQLADAQSQAQEDDDAACGNFPRVSADAPQFPPIAS
jgi:nuclear transcription factor Y, alpha